MQHRMLPMLAVAVLLVGAGCGRTETPPAANAPTANVPAVNAPKPGGSGTDAPSVSLKPYRSEPYDFSYPGNYTITDRAMTDTARKPYLDKGLDAPLQYTSLAVETRPPGFQGEGPPTVYVILWNNAQGTPLREWAKKQAIYTLFEEQADVATPEFQGHPSLVYDYDGLYGGKTRLIDLGGTVLQVSADFDKDAGNTNMQAYETILTTLSVK